MAECPEKTVCCSTFPAAAGNGWLDERSAVLESLLSIKRAGASAILTYNAIAAARCWMDMTRASD